MYGTVRKIDTLGRITLPKEVRTVLNMPENTAVEIIPQKDGVFIRRYLPSANIIEKLEAISDEVSHNRHISNKNDVIDYIIRLKELINNGN